MKRWPAILLFGLLAGCARFHSQPILPAATADQLEERRFNDPGLEKLLQETLTVTNPPAASWDLESLTLAAFYFHPSLKVARAQWRLADAGVKTAGGRPNPILAVTPGYNSTTHTPSPWIPAVSVDIPIETAGKRDKRIREARKMSEAANWNLMATAWQVRRNLRGWLSQYAVAEKRTDILRTQASIQKQITQLLQERLDAGAISRPELTLMQIASHKTQLALADAEQKTAEARGRLAEAIGVSVAALNDIKVEREFTQRADEITSVEARRVALQSRPDILAALADYAAVEAGLELQIARQYPDVHFNPGYQYDQGDNKWTIGLSVELPVLNQNQGPIAEAEARRKLAAARFLALQAQVMGEIDRATETWRAARSQRQTAEQLLAAAKTQARALEAQAKAGAADKLEVANARLEFSAAALTQLEIVAQSQRAEWALEDALQRPDALMLAAVTNLADNRESIPRQIQKR